MNETEQKAQSGAPASVGANGQGGTAAEMRRQMEAAKLRMQKYHAVYGKPGSSSDAPPVNRPDER